MITPHRGRNKPASQKAANRAHAQLRASAERANAQLKAWHILRKLRCCPWRAGHLAKATTSFKPTKLPDEKGSICSRETPFSVILAARPA